ncbi:unnamed protein product [[Candida] boidinii]|nr:unnamed protein product [[Candida] boidinii]
MLTVITFTIRTTATVIITTPTLHNQQLMEQQLIHPLVHKQQQPPLKELLNLFLMVQLIKTVINHIEITDKIKINNNNNSSSILKTVV